MIVANALQHVALDVSDLERARHFYGVVLGLKEIERPAFDFRGAWYGIGDSQLHLLEYPAGRTFRGTTEIDTRDGHFAVRVASYTQTLRHLQASGVAYRAVPKGTTSWAQIFVTDPDGNVIELNAESATT